MDSIHECFKKYKQSEFVKCDGGELMKRLKIVLSKLKYSYNSPSVKYLSKSIQYPYQNGKFVILLDVCSQNEFIRYVQTSYIPYKHLQHIHSFYKKIKSVSDENINVHNYKLTSFKNRKIKYMLNTKPKLSHVLEKY